MTIFADFWTTNLPCVAGAYYARCIGSNQFFVVQVVETPEDLMVNISGSPLACDVAEGWQYICEMNNEEFEWQGPLFPAGDMTAELVAIQAITASIDSRQCWTAEHGDSEAVGPISSALEEAAGRLNEEHEDNLTLLIKTARQLLALRATVAALQDSKPGFNEAQWNAVADAMAKSDSATTLAETILSK
jgi:hypothetical protein